eukprot:167985-Amphidinium_carterae.1
MEGCLTIYACDCKTLEASSTRKGRHRIGKSTANEEEENLPKGASDQKDKKSCFLENEKGRRCLFEGLLRVKKGRVEFFEGALEGIRRWG